jgi:hypothetical protein
LLAHFLPPRLLLELFILFQLQLACSLKLFLLLLRQLLVRYLGRYGIRLETMLR